MNIFLTEKIVKRISLNSNLLYLIYQTPSTFVQLKSL